MRFASHIREMEVSGIRKCFEGAGPTCVNLSIGQPDFDTPMHVKEAAIKAIRDGFTGYTPNLGVPDLREAISQKFRKDNGLDYSPSQIMVTSGASEALFLAVASLVEEGDEVLVPDPGFLSYAALTRSVGGKAVGVPLSGDLTLTPEAVQERVTSRTKAIIVNSPGNPTGAVQSKEELQGVAQVADDCDLALISDEVYEHFIYQGEHVSPARFSDNVITINAVSKTYAMTGWRLGYLAASEEAVEEMLKIHQYSQACASSISQVAAHAALAGPQDCVSTMKEAFRRRRDLLVKSLEEMGVDFVVPQGAFYLFPRVGDGDGTAASLLQNGVITVPGSAFGPRGKEHIRISYAASDESILTAIERMREIL
ncbi:MAG: pyridoxal phosphate-dependent aminotransferase [Methanosarcinales archaeon]|nr:pyridoxal phosphate-dependent aminotransferase [Methanosarcinales archaeon]